MIWDLHNTCRVLEFKLSQIDLNQLSVVNMFFFSYFLQIKFTRDWLRLDPLAQATKTLLKKTPSMSLFKTGDYEQLDNTNDLCDAFST